MSSPGSFFYLFTFLFLGVWGERRCLGLNVDCGMFVRVITYMASSNLYIDLLLCAILVHSSMLALLCFPGLKLYLSINQTLYN